MPDTELLCSHYTSEGEACAEPDGHDGMHMTAPDSDGNVLAWWGWQPRLVAVRDA